MQLLPQPTFAPGRYPGAPRSIAHRFQVGPWLTLGKEQPPDVSRVASGKFTIVRLGAVKGATMVAGGGWLMAAG